MALLHNNLGVTLWCFEGPAASLEVLREGIAYAKARGSPRCSTRSRQSSLDPLVDTGEHDEALEARRRDGPAPGGERGRVRPRRRSAAAQARIFALRGAGRTGGRLRSSGSSPPPARPRTRNSSSLVWASAALVRAALGQDEAAAALLTELESYPGAREQRSTTASCSPRWCAPPCRIGEPALAERLVAGLEPRYPYAEHAARRGQRRPHRGSRGPAGSRRCLRRCRRSLGAVRGRPRAGVRAPRPGPVPPRTLPTDRGRTRPAARPRDLRTAPGGPRARRDRRAPAPAAALTFGGDALDSCAVAEDHALMLPKPLPGHRPRKT